MKKPLYPIAFALTAFLLAYSCSPEEEDTTPPPSVVKPTTPEPEPEPEVTQYTLTVTTGEGGTVSTEGGTYDEGTEVTITATPEEGYEFAGWEGSDSTEASLTVTLGSNTTLNALFEFICVPTQFVEYSKPSYETFRIIHPNDITQVNENVSDYLHRYGTEKIMLDYNLDGFLDFIAFENDYDTNNNRQPILFYLGDCEGNLTIDEENSNKFDGLIHGRKILLGDYNNDGFPDVFLIGHGWDKPPYPGEYPVILFSSEGGIFREERLIQFSGYFHGGSSGDYDNDGDLDVILNTLQLSNNSFVFLENDGNGNFTEFNDMAPFTNNEEHWYLNSEMYDLNNDGNLDILFMSMKEGDELINNGTLMVNFSTDILYGNGKDFKGEKIKLPKLEGWENVYDIEIYDLDNNGKKELILNRLAESGYFGWYIQILELIDGNYVDNTEKFIDFFTSTDSTWNVWLEIRDFDNDGIVEMRNNVPKAVEEKEVTYNPNPKFFYHEWELIDGKFIKID